jgi:hypothetical protein
MASKWNPWRPSLHNDQIIGWTHSQDVPVNRMHPIDGTLFFAWEDAVRREVAMNRSLDAERIHACCARRGIFPDPEDQGPRT